MVDLSSAIFCGAMAVIFCGAMVESSSAISCGATAESSSAISCGGMQCGAMTESSSESSSAIFCNPSVFCGGTADSSSAIFCSALADSSLPTNDSPSSLAIFCGAVGDSSSPTGDSPMAEIKDIAVAESSSPIDDEVWRLFSGEKTARKASGGGATTIWVLFMLLGYRMLSLIFHCLVTVLYLGPAVTNFINKAFVILREINRGFAEINRGFAEIKRGFAEIKKGVAVLRRIMLGRRMWKFLIAFFLVCICILYVSSLPHIREVSTPPQVEKINGGFKLGLGHVKEPPVL